MSMISQAGARAFPVAQAAADERATFIKRTYGHLAGAIGAFVALEYVLFQTNLGPAMLRFIMGAQYGWLLFLGAFILAGWLARGMAANAGSRGMQYLGLGIYVVAEAIIFLPILYIAASYSAPSVLPNAAILTIVVFLGLTAVAFGTRADFSFLRGIIAVGGLLAMGMIVCGIIFGFNLGLWFSVAMVGLASAAILYDTSKIIHQYSTDQYVGAALELFASVALLFWYILRIMMQMSRR